MKVFHILVFILGIVLVVGGFAFDSITNFGTCRVLGICIVIPLLDAPLDLGFLITFLGIDVVVSVILKIQSEKGSDIPPIEKIS